MTREIRPEHLVVGALQNAGPDLAATLAGFGIDLSVVRENVDRTFGADSFDNALRPSDRVSRRRAHLPFTRAAKRALQLALREALAHSNNWIGCEHIVLGILRANDPAALALLTAHVDADELRRSIGAVLDAAA